eukprot:comp24262_c9_seq1/m.45100 comp24262_c9_seq1/g.45100  ORF comp24262_c9_seq1/g.45100 comp24262_c9_seq1/m.45100 type:complete len:481 (-) comp24262_c9_seq1:843-2285(-)
MTATTEERVFGAGDTERQALLGDGRPDTYGEKTSIGSEDESDVRQASFFSGVMNLSNTILGAGLLALPSAFAQCGYILGSVMLLLGAMGSSFGLHLLNQCAHRIGGCTTNFHAVANRSYPHIAFLADLAVAIKCFGVATSYLVVIGDLLPRVVLSVAGDTLDDTSLLYRRQFWISAVMLVLIVPMAYQRHLYALRYMSFFAIVSVCYTVILIVLFNFLPSLGACEKGGVIKPDCVGRIQAVVPGLSVLSSLPVFVFSYTCHQNIFTIYNERALPYEQRESSVNKVIITSIGTATIFYLIVGNCGYFTYGDHVSANVLKDYPADSRLVYVGQCMIAFLVTCCYPLQCHPARTSITKIVNHFTEDAFDHKPRSTFLYIAITTLHLLGTYLIAFFVTDLGKVFAVIGATGSTIICYILPGLFFYKMFEDSPEYKPKRMVALSMVFIGLLIMSCSLTFQFLPKSALCRIYQEGSRKWVDSGCAH